MSAWTLFTRLQAALSNGEDTNPDTSAVYLDASDSSKHNVTFYRRETVELDAEDTRTITFPNTAATAWVLILARVIGTAKITTVGVDFDNSTPIGSNTGGYGTSDHPGIIGMTTFNVSTFTLEGVADSTTVEYIACILAEDDQL